MNEFSHRTDQIQPFHVMRLLAKARSMEAQGRDIVHMEVGEPDFATPAPIMAAGMKALSEAKTHYTPALGLPALREAISNYYQTSYGLNIDPQRIVVTPGASGALQLLMALLVNPGDEVLLADPGYPCNRNMVHLFAGKPLSIPVAGSEDAQLNAALVEKYWRNGQTGGVMVTTPSNPTGSVMEPQALKDIQSVVRAKNGFLIVDEIYQGLTYDAPDTTALALDSDIFVVNSFSKYFGMTGWRVGWLVAPESAIPELDKLAQNLFLATSTPSQYAALAAFTLESRDILEQRRITFRERRDFLLPALEGLGFSFPHASRGAFYLYGDCRSLAQDSAALAVQLLDKAGVAVTPGLDFSVIDPSSYMRFAYTSSRERLALGIDRIRRNLISAQ
jgi:aspartate/methionine/tyrosine aminotransferase